ncbi:hypothetical protein AC578_7669 [Pseudocercospora eumusae]|uniref:Uncharacterized protein n=1 Tax=Pseudocercospora eumusae TaxID=321146 RepID=A0A139GXI2_9PEZI|nr:hypothetical protein AC578_7669 [Pseudocercospora eumusae]
METIKRLEGLAEELQMLILNNLTASDIHAVLARSPALQKLASLKQLGKGAVACHQSRLQGQIANLCNFETGDHSNEYANSAFIKALVDRIEIHGLPLDEPNYCHAEYLEFAEQWLRRAHNVVNTQTASAHRQITMLASLCMNFISIHLHFHKPGYQLALHSQDRMYRALERSESLGLLRMSRTQLQTVLQLAHSKGLFTAAGNRSEAWFRRPRAIFHSSCDTITNFLDDMVGIPKPARPGPFTYGFSTSKAYELVALSSKKPEGSITTLEKAFLLEIIRISPLGGPAEDAARRFPDFRFRATANDFERQLVLSTSVVSKTCRFKT